MPIKITKGRVNEPARCLLYGRPGVGKSSLLSKANALYIDIERSTQELDVARVECEDWRSIEHTTKDLITDTQGFSTIVYDSADWLERRLIEHMTKKNGGKGIEQWDGGYGKGYTMLCEEFGKFLAECGKLTSKGVNVVFTAHSHVKRASPPDQTDGYDRYELKLSKNIAPLLLEWSTLILFYNYKVELVKGTDRKVKGSGGTERVIYTTQTAAFDAKNRYGLPSEIAAPNPAEAYAALAHIFGKSALPAMRVDTGDTVTSSTTKTVVMEAPVVMAPTPEPEAIPEADLLMISAEQLGKIELYRKNSVGWPLVEKALGAANAVGIDELTAGEAEELIKTIQAAMNGVTSADNGAPSVTAMYSAWFDANAEKINAYLVRVNWLTVGQGWRELSSEKLNQIIEKCDKFAKAAGVPAIGGAK